MMGTKQTLNDFVFVEIPGRLGWMKDYLKTVKTKEPTSPRPEQIHSVYPAIKDQK